MRIWRHDSTTYSAIGGCIFAASLLLSGLLLGGTALAQEAVIQETMRYPAGDQSSPQPTGLYVDWHTGDIYVADAANARIAIYDSQRRYNFEFSTRDRLSTPQQVAVDSQGRIFVLGDTRKHTLSVFDYNGDFLNYLDLPYETNGAGPMGIALDDSDQLYMLTAEPAHIYVYTTSGEAVRDFPILQEADDETQATPVMSGFAVMANEMIVTLPIIGQIARIDFDGKLIRIFGYPGGGQTELSFPVACCKTNTGEYVILDKHRHLLQYYSADGQYLREIGYPGLDEGYFFHPSSLACCLDGTLVVGQIYNNRIQSVVFRNEPVVSGGS
ncbi:MAG: NHL repeat-containing protein [Calditrichaeota bacterium]|nr:NHL repeat-containing protein [Calditrichota bacterium]MCB9369841.1 NHL repeat-containing protein [Calditrichota bacterium]